MRYIQQAPVGRVTPGIRDARLIEFIGPQTDLNFHFVQTMLEAGLVVREVNRPSGNADALILAFGLGAGAAGVHASAMAALTPMAKHLEDRSGTLILLQDTGGAFQPRDHRAWHGGFAGLGRTAQKEFPGATVRTIDIDMASFGPRPAADRVLEELLTGGTAPVVGLTPAGRVVPDDQPVRLPPNHPGRIGRNDNIVVSGGARGVTADCVIELARRTQANFVLLGRSAIAEWPAGIDATSDERLLRGALAKLAKATGEKLSPADINARARSALAGAEIRHTLEQIRLAGSRAIYIPTDVANPNSLRTAMGEAQSTFGPVTGLVHGAGVLADKLIREKTPEQVERVFAPKVDGLRSLLSELDPNTLKHIAFFSSVAARYGNSGQADYAMANEVLNRVARWLKAARPDTMVTSIGWGPWDGGMVDASLSARFAEMGIALIGRPEGARLFADAMLAGPDCPVELVVGSELGHG